MTISPERTSHAVSERLARIDWFTTRNNLVPRTYSGLGRTILLLDQPDLSKLDGSHVNNYLELSRRLAKSSIDDSHYASMQALLTGKLTGRMAALSDVDGFRGFSGHSMNFHHIGEDDSAVALDFSAGNSVDQHGEHFNALACRAQSLGALTGIVSELYGGDWRYLRQH